MIEEGLNQREMAIRLGLDESLISHYSKETQPGRPAITGLFVAFPEREQQIIAAIIASYTWSRSKRKEQALSLSTRQ